jgi:hypothetical protein
MKNIKPLFGLLFAVVLAAVFMTVSYPSNSTYTPSQSLVHILSINT